MYCLCVLANNPVLSHYFRMQRTTFIGLICPLIILQTLGFHQAVACGFEEPAEPGRGNSQTTKLVTEEQVKELLKKHQNESVSKKIDIFSKLFLGTRYLTEAFGEGSDGIYDQDPLYRFDAFDCTTYVETVLALSHSRDIENFKSIINTIRYADGIVSFPFRNHFPEIDWIPNNTDAGYIFDTTAEVAGFHPVHLAETSIDKRSWYQHLTIRSIQVPGADQMEKEKLLTDLRAEGAGYEIKDVQTQYLHLRTMENNPDIFKRFPAAAVINVVRPNWLPNANYGTTLNISHQAIVIRKNGKVFIRHANSHDKKVAESLLIDELKTYANSKTIKGINVLALRSH